MDTGETLRIGDVVSRTGLTERMIRHYEHKGLIAPRRTDAGQRVFDTDDMTRLAIIQLLKRAGMGLAAIGAWLSGGVDAKNLIRAELELLRDDARRTSAAIAVLESLQSELPDGAHLDLAQLTRIFETTATAPSEDTAAAFFQRHFAPSDAAQWQQLTTRLTRAVDPHDYDPAWRTLADDIKAALPLGPDSPRARQLLKRWDTLLAPFMRIASEKQQRLARTMWQNVDQWGEAHNQPVTAEIIDFIRRARTAQQATEKRKHNAQPGK